MWLLLQVDLRFVEGRMPISPRGYHPDLQTRRENHYYGVHFVLAPEKISAGERLTATLVVRAFPKDPCTALQGGEEIFIKEGPLTRAEGTVISRQEYESSATTVVELLQELERAPGTQ
jgi:hypothetical protein